MIDIKLLEDKKLKEEVSRNYSEIASQEYRFDRVETEVKYLRCLKKRDIVDCYEKNILNNKTQFIIAIEGEVL